MTAPRNTEAGTCALCSVTRVPPSTGSSVAVNTVCAAKRGAGLPSRRSAS
jgi:hypothetical protein